MELHVAYPWCLAAKGAITVRFAGTKGLQIEAEVGVQFNLQWGNANGVQEGKEGRHVWHAVCAPELQNDTTLGSNTEHRFFSNGEWLHRETERHDIPTER